MSGDLLEGLPPTTTSPKSQVVIFGVRNSRGRGYVFLPVYDLNLLYFQQGGESAHTSLTVKLHPW